MPESKLREIADAADMIVSGFAFNKNGEMIRIVNLNKKDPHVLIINTSGKVLESSMDPIEQTIALEIWQNDAEFMEDEEQGDGPFVSVPPVRMNRGAETKGPSPFALRCAAPCVAVAVDNRGAVGGVARSVGIEGFPEGVGTQGDHFAPVFLHQFDGFFLQAGLE